MSEEKEKMVDVWIANNCGNLFTFRFPSRIVEQFEDFFDEHGLDQVVGTNSNSCSWGVYDGNLRICKSEEKKNMVDACCCSEDFETPCEGDPEERCANCSRLFCSDHWEEIEDVYYCEVCGEEFCRPCGKDHIMTCEGDDDDEGDEEVLKAQDFDDNEVCVIQAYCLAHNICYDQVRFNLDNFRDAYCGNFDSDGDFCRDYTEGCYDLTTLPDWLVNAINWERIWDTAFQYDYTNCDGHYFRSDHDFIETKPVAESDLP